MGSISGGWSLSSSTSSSSSSSSESKKKKRIAMAFLNNERPRLESSSCRLFHRRSLLFGSISVLPFMEIAAVAVPNPTEGKQGIEKPGEQEPGLKEQDMLSLMPSQPQRVPLQEAGNSFLSLLSTLGIIGSGVLGALYTTSQKEKAAVKSTIESMEMKLFEKDAAAAWMKENFERRLLKEQEERKKQVTLLEEEESSLSSHLSSANEIIAALGREEQTDKKLAEEFKFQVAQLESTVIQVQEDKKLLQSKLKEKTEAVDLLQDSINLLILDINDKEKNIETLNSSLTEKESELMNLNSIIDQTRTDLSEAKSIVEELKKDILQTEEEVHSKEVLIDCLNGKVEILNVEKDDISSKFHDLVKEYDDFKSSCKQREALHSEQISEKDDQLRLLKEKLEITISDISNNQTIITKLTRERDDCKGLLEKEMNEIKNVKDKLRATKGALEASQIEVAILYNNLEEAKSTSEVLSQELISIKEVLKRTEEELKATSNELKPVMGERESLKKELMEIYTKLETTVKELKEERTVVDTLKRNLEALGKQIVEDTEARRVLEEDLIGATCSLHEMNKSAISLSMELENANSRAAILEAEKVMILQAITEQENIVKEEEENIEDAQNLITTLRSERGSLEKRRRKLEEELALAKGEILRLRRQFTMKENSVERDHQEPNDVDGSTPVKKTGSRRRKGSLSSESS